MIQLVHPAIVRSATVAVALLSFCAFPASAMQSPTPQTFHLNIVDSTGAAIANARVSLRPTAGGTPAAATSDAQGEIHLTLSPGAYIVTVNADRFLDATQTVTVPAAGAATLSITLGVAGVTETVGVVADAGYVHARIRSATKTETALHDTPQAVTVVTDTLIKDQLMTSIGDVVRYMPGITAHQGENNRDQVIIRGNSSSADFFINGVRDDVQYYRDLYNLDRVEALMGPNAVIFGRGGAGGVINRVTKEAGFLSARELTLQGGAFDNGRFVANVNQPLSSTVAVRFDGMYENADSFRDGVTLDRHGLSPSLTFAPRQNTKLVVRYEDFRDERTADRGITSFQGRPADVDITTYYGNPNDSHVRAAVDIVSATLEHRTSRVVLRNQTSYGDYDRFYQNYVPGAATADKSQVALTSYNNATRRKNTFNQTDVVTTLATGSVRHTLVTGLELGQQLSDNVRNTGFFNNTATSIMVPFSAPTISTPVTFRQNATDADNHVKTMVAAAYAQDQVEIVKQLKAVAGLRFDRFDLTYHNNRTSETLGRVDNLVSPRAGLIYQPIVPLSLYTSYSVSYLPGSGDQFSSLTNITQQLKPEQFTNHEVGAKWNARPDFALTTAVYRLDRTNTRSTDPNDPTRIVQTGSQRSKGVEMGLNGRVTKPWSIAGGYAHQNAVVTSATAAAPLGARVAQVPSHSVSLWNNYQFTQRLSAAVGIVHRSDMFATIDNSVTVPSYTKADIAAFYLLNARVRLQMNLDNITNAQYYVNADSNTNISPGRPRSVRVGLTTTF